MAGRGARGVIEASIEADNVRDRKPREEHEMSWLWSGRGKPRSRPRVARAIVEARAAQAGTASARFFTPDLGGATALVERAAWSNDLPAFTPTLATPRGGWGGGWGGATSTSVSDSVYMADVAGGNDGGYGGGQATPTRARDFGQVGLLLERAEDTARRLGRSRAEMWEEALSAWLKTQLAEDASGALASDEPDCLAGVEAHPAPRPWLFEARRQRVWGEIDETLGDLRTA